MLANTAQLKAIYDRTEYKPLHDLGFGVTQVRQIVGQRVSQSSFAEVANTLKGELATLHVMKGMKFSAKHMSKILGNSKGRLANALSELHAGQGHLRDLTSNPNGFSPDDVAVMLSGTGDCLSESIDLLMQNKDKLLEPTKFGIVASRIAGSFIKASGGTFKSRLELVLKDTKVQVDRFEESKARLLLNANRDAGPHGKRPASDAVVDISLVQAQLQASMHHKAQGQSLDGLDSIGTFSVEATAGLLDNSAHSLDDQVNLDSKRPAISQPGDYPDKKHRAI